MTVKTSNILNIVIPIINSVTSVNLKKAGMGSRNNVMKKNKTRCYDQLCSGPWTSSFLDILAD